MVGRRLWQARTVLVDDQEAETYGRSSSMGSHKPHGVRAGPPALTWKAASRAPMAEHTAAIYLSAAPTSSRRSATRRPISAPTTTTSDTTITTTATEITSGSRAGNLSAPYR